MNQTTGHISFEEMVDHAGGSDGADRRAGTAAHLRGCGRCRAQYRRVEIFIEAMRTDVTEEVPAHVLERTFDLFSQRPRSTAPDSIGQRIVAVLRESVPLGVPAFGIRSGGAAESRRMTFTARDHQVEIVTRKSDAGWSVDGEIDGGWIGGTALLNAGSDWLTAEIGDLGEFSFRDVPDGTYELTLNRPGSGISITGIEIGDASSQ